MLVLKNISKKALRLSVFKNHLRKLSDATSKEVDEIRITVPWGHIAAKWWGPKTSRPILGLHGWQDNCGTFDTLAPLLPADVGFLAIDMPGCGYSSRYPKGFRYDLMHDTFYLLEHIQAHFNWSKLSLLGHSLGGMVAFKYASLFPEKVDLLIQLDVLKPFAFLPEIYNQMLISLIVQTSVCENYNVEPPSFAYEKLVDKLSNSFITPIPKEVCRHLLERAIAPSKSDPNKFYFTRDPRVKIAIPPFMPQKDSLFAADNIVCPILNIKVKDCPHIEEQRFVDEVLDRLKKVNSQFERVLVDGRYHHMHLLTPEPFAAHINQFLQKYWRTKQDT